MDKSYVLPDPASAPELFEGLLTRRVIAHVIDLVILGILGLVAVMIGTITGFLTLGLGWLSIPLLVPAAIALYYVVTLGTSRRATIGMQMMDIVMTPVRGKPLDGWQALAHPLVFWITCWILPPFSLLLALFTPRRQLLHDLIVGVLFVRRSPMARHWSAVQAA